MVNELLWMTRLTIICFSYLQMLGLIRIFFPYLVLSRLIAALALAAQSYIFNIIFFKHRWYCRLVRRRRRHNSLDHDESSNKPVRARQSHFWLYVVNKYCHFTMIFLLSNCGGKCECGCVFARECKLIQSWTRVPFELIQELAWCMQ